MSAPTNLDTSTNSLPIAWNSFAHTDFFRQNNGTITQLQAVEPIKVGVGMPFGSLQIQKILTGDIPAGSLIGPFQASYTCTLTPATGAAVTVASGSGTFSVDAPLTVAHIPVGASCSVWETDTGGGNADHPVSNPFLTTITSDPADLPTLAPLTNDFPAPRLIITKAITGAAAAYAAGPFVISVDCQLAGVPVPGYPRDLTFTGAGSQSITDLPIGATCTVHEPDDRGATAVTTTYSNGDHADISALVDAVATITNTYDPADLTVTKTVAGPGGTGPYTFAATCT